MTPDNRQPRRRRRRRRSAASFAGQPPSTGESIQLGQMGNSENPQGGGDGPLPMPGNVPGQGPGQGPGGPGGGGRRRRRSRHRRREGGGGGMMQHEGSSAPMEVPSGELVPTGGVLYIKPNGTGL